MGRTTKKKFSLVHPISIETPASFRLFYFFTFLIYQSYALISYSIIIGLLLTVRILIVNDKVFINNSLHIVVQRSELVL